MTLMTHCKTCGAEIVWGLTKNGRKVPMDPPEKRYVMKANAIVEIEETWLSHFATCPQADLHRVDHG